ncbi:MAG: hypothetical protein HQ503_14195 [Rhodospirillales bacterium]|nr:hypothetical protein [Rhodospirillales bacterium]
MIGALLLSMPATFAYAQSAGDDVIKAGPGNDKIDAGPGDDVDTND